MSNYTKATNFASKDSLSTGNPAKIIKGTEIDSEYTAIASAISSKADSNSPTLTGTPLAPTASSGTSTTQIATTAFVSAALTVVMPSGGIILWSGSVATIPSGWYLCNGQTVGALTTPDLRDKFIVGAGSTYAVAATGGSANAIVVSHTHTATVTDSGHNHTFTSPTSYLEAAVGGSGNNPLGPSTTGTTGTATTGITVGISTTGSSATDANLPPYYALCYIMKA